MVMALTAAERSRRWRERHPGAQAKAYAAWVKANYSYVLECNRQWYARNREQRAEKNREWYKNHPGYWKKRSRAKLNTVERAYYARNATRLAAEKREYNRTHPAKVKASNLRQRAQRTAAPGYASPEQIAARIAYYGGRCAYCQTGVYEQLDHVIPIARGGSNWPANLRPACRRCNQSKKAKKLTEWRPLLQ